MAEASLINAAMQKAIGVESAAETYDIEKGHIRRFAEAIGDANALFTDEARARETPVGGIVAPPTFLRSCVAPPPPIDPQQETGLSRILDGGSDWEYFHRVRPADRISVRSKIIDFREREGRMGKMLITTTQLTYRNQLGQVVATQTGTRIMY